jgi:hypothetical protein
MTCPRLRCATPGSGSMRERTEPGSPRLSPPIRPPTLKASAGRGNDPFFNAVWSQELFVSPAIFFRWSLFHSPSLMPGFFRSGVHGRYHASFRGQHQQSPAFRRCSHKMMSIQRVKRNNLTHVIARCCLARLERQRSHFGSSRPAGRPSPFDGRRNPTYLPSPPCYAATASV